MHNVLTDVSYGIVIHDSYLMSIDMDDKLSCTVVSLAPLPVGKLADGHVHHDIRPLPRPGEEEIGKYKLANINELNR